VDWRVKPEDGESCREVGGKPADTLVERLELKLRAWPPETAAQVRQRLGEIVELADQGALDVVRSLGDQ